MSETEKPQSPSNSEIALKAIAAIVKEVGISNFLVIFLSLFLLVFATQDQKERFITNWILLESTNHSYCYIVIALVIVVAIIGGIYYRTMLRNAKKELLRIGQEKSDLQEILLKTGLSSSKKKH